MKIGIVGAGVSGLTLAAALRQLAPSVEAELYEQDASATQRMQGYSLGLKGDGGLPVLATLGLRELLDKEAITIANFVFCDQRGQRLMELRSGSDETRQTRRVRREALKTALLDAARGTPMHWGLRCSGYQATDNGVEVTFADGSRQAVDYLIACDGVASAVRQK